MPLIETRGAGSAQGFGEFAQSAAPVYIEDVFSTYLYTGNGSTQTITNGIDLSGKGGLVWVKNRAGATTDHVLGDTVRGASKQIFSNRTIAEQNYSPYGISAFGTTGFTVADDGAGNYITNANTVTYASWTFRKQAKFFDIVTYTGNGQNDRQISHNLGSTPGCIIVKCLYFTGAGGPANWSVYHRSISPSQSLFLNTTAAAAANDGLFGTPTSTYFVVNQPGGGNTLNANGDQYVAYIFAHDAGGFGLSGSDNVISCGSFTTDGSGNATVTLGYEPQWVLTKQSSGTGNWSIVDSMRGNATLNGTTSTEQVLRANSSIAEFASYGYANPTSTGFVASGWAASETLIYIAIRRGPMKVPTSGTSVFTPIAKTGDGSTTTVTNVGFPTDLFMFKWTASAYGWKQQDRLRGFEQQLSSDQTGGESNSGTYTFGTVNNTGYTYGANASTSGELNGSGVTSSVLAFRRAPGFFDIVCFAGGSTNAARTYTHNLGVQPELIIVKERNVTGNWYVATNQGAKSGESIDTTKNHTGFQLNGTAAVTFGTTQNWSDVCSSTVFVTNGAASYITDSAGNTAQWSVTSTNFVAYLFATVAGVSKVGSYTGTGTTLQIDCGFTGGARFVLIKRTDSTGDWYVYDSARGIVAGNDPYLLLNSTAAEVTNTDYIDTYSAGFELSSTAPAALNANGGTYIFLAIA